MHNSVKELEKKFNKITYEHIYRQYNKLTDSLVNEALNNYTGFGKNYKEILLDY